MLAFIIKVLFSCIVGITIVGGICMFIAMIVDCNNYDEEDDIYDY